MDRKLGRPRSIRKQKNCEICGQSFFNTYAAQEQRFCSKKCELVWRSTSQNGQNNPNWKRGWYIAKHSGYKYYSGNGTHRIAQRVVMEKKLGRELKKGEIVHHINGIKTDNRPKNLVLTTRVKHSDFHKGIFTCPNCHNQFFAISQ